MVAYWRQSDCGWKSSTCELERKLTLGNSLPETTVRPWSGGGSTTQGNEYKENIYIGTFLA